MRLFLTFLSRSEMTRKSHVSGLKGPPSARLLLEEEPLSFAFAPAPTNLGITASARKQEGGEGRGGGRRQSLGAYHQPYSLGDRGLHLSQPEKTKPGLNQRALSEPDREI